MFYWTKTILTNYKFTKSSIEQALIEQPFLRKAMTLGYAPKWHSDMPQNDTNLTWPNQLNLTKPNLT